MQHSLPQELPQHCAEQLLIVYKYIIHFTCYYSDEFPPPLRVKFAHSGDPLRQSPNMLNTIKIQTKKTASASQSLECKSKP